VVSKSREGDGEKLDSDVVTAPLPPVKNLPRTDMQGGGTRHLELEGSAITDSNLMEDTPIKYVRLDGNLVEVLP